MSSSSSSSCQISLFDNDCVVNSPCRVDFDFIDDCTLPPLPDPIYDCDDPVPPVFEPPPPEFCLDIRADDEGPNVTVTYVNNNCGSSSSAQPSGGIIISKTVDCDYVIGFDLDLPIPLPPCPTFTNKKPPTVVVVFDNDGCSSSSSAGNTITITPNPTDDCDGPCSFDIDLNLLIPLPKIRCPIFSDNNPVTVSSKYQSCAPNGSRLVVSSQPVPGDCQNNDTCQFTIDLDLVIPIPDPPCPKINSEQTVAVKSYVQRQGCTIPPSRFRVTTTPVPGNCATNTPETCQFDFDLDLAIPLIEPPCPKFNDGDVKINTYDETEFVPPSTLKFVKKPPNVNCQDFEECEFDIELDLHIPVPIPPCPRIKTIVNQNQVTPGQNFAITQMLFGPPQKDAFTEECTFFVDFALTVPPIPPFVLFQEAKIERTSCVDPIDQGYTLTFKEELAFNQNTNRWELKITPELIVPSFPQFQPGTVTVNGGLGSGEIRITGDKCSPQIDLILTLNTAACATGGGGGGGDPSSSPPPSLTCDPTTCQGSCPSGQVCSMAGGGSGCGCVSMLLAELIDSGADFCNDPSYICPEDAALFCPPGTRCNPYTDF